MSRQNMLHQIMLSRVYNKSVIKCIYLRPWFQISIKFVVKNLIIPELFW